MNDEPFNSERRQAELLDERITNAQSGVPPQNDTEAKLKRFVEIGRAIRADETFVNRLETQLSQRYRRSRRIERWRWLGAAAAMMITIFLVVGVLHTLRPGEISQPTKTIPSTTPIALAATSTLAIEIDRTDSALSALAHTPTATTTATTTATATATATAPPSAMPLPTNTPAPMTATALPSATTVLIGTPTPAAVATIIPAVYPTAPTILSPARIDVMFVVDSSAGIEELENSLDKLFHHVSQAGARFGLVTMGKDGVQTIDFTRDISVLRAALQMAEVAGDSSNPWGALLNETLTGVNWRESQSTPVIIGLVSKPPSEDYTQYVQAMATQSITLHIIVLGDMEDKDVSVFQDMAQITGGRLAVLDEANSTLDALIAQWIIVLPSG